MTQVLGSAAIRFHHEYGNEGKSEKRIHHKSKKVTQITIKWGKYYSRNEYMASGCGCGVGLLHWEKEELKSIDIKTRKLIIMNESLHQRGNIGRLYLVRKER